MASAGGSGRYNGQDGCGGGFIIFNGRGQKLSVVTLWRCSDSTPPGEAFGGMESSIIIYPRCLLFPLCIIIIIIKIITTTSRIPRYLCNNQYYYTGVHTCRVFRMIVVMFFRCHHLKFRVLRLLSINDERFRQTILKSRWSLTLKLKYFRAWFWGIPSASRRHPWMGSMVWFQISW